MAKIPEITDEEYRTFRKVERHFSASDLQVWLEDNGYDLDNMDQSLFDVMLNEAINDFEKYIDWSAINENKEWLMTDRFTEEWFLQAAEKINQSKEQANNKALEKKISRPQEPPFTDTKGRVVLDIYGAENGREDALVFNIKDVVTPYVFAFGYDKETGAWSQGTYFSELSNAIKHFEERKELYRASEEPASYKPPAKHQTQAPSVAKDTSTSTPMQAVKQTEERKHSR